MPQRASAWMTIPRGHPVIQAPYREQADESPSRYTNDIYLNLGGGISYRGGYHADKDGIGVQWGEAGNTGNMPVPLPDGTKLEEFWNVEWERTVENDVADWKTVAEVAAAVAAIAALVWVVANDLTIVGVLDDALIVPICTYLATSAPALYQHFINTFPQLQGIVSNVSNCME